MSDNVLHFREMCALIGALGRCHARFRAFAISLRSRQGVISSVHNVNIVDLPAATGAAFRVDENVGVELATGDALAWVIELRARCDPAAVTIEAGVWRVESAGSYLIHEVMDREFSAVDECVIALEDAVLRLCDHVPLP